MLFLVHSKIEWSQPPKLFHCFSPKFSCFDLPPNGREKASTTILVYSWIQQSALIYLFSLMLLLLLVARLRLSFWLWFRRSLQLMYNRPFTPSVLFLRTCCTFQDAVVVKRRKTRPNCWSTSCLRDFL